MSRGASRAGVQATVGGTFSTPFYKQPILKSPYQASTRRHSLDSKGRPLDESPRTRAPACASPTAMAIPKPREEPIINGSLPPRSQIDIIDPSSGSSGKSHTVMHSQSTLDRARMFRIPIQYQLGRQQQLAVLWCRVRGALIMPGADSAENNNLGRCQSWRCIEDDDRRRLDRNVRGITSWCA